MSPRRYWAGTLAAAVTVSVAGNVGHAWLTAPEPLRVPAALAAALPPLALLVVTEGLVRSAGHRARRWTYRAGVTGAVCIAGLAFVLSFAALRDLAIALGQPATVAAGWPLLADAAIAVSSVMLLATKPEDPAAAGDGHLDGQVAAPVATPATAPATAPATSAAPLTYPTGNAWLTSGNSLAGVLATGEIDVAESEIAVAEPDLGEAERIIGAAGIAATPTAVAVAVATLAAGRSQRAAATESGLHRTQVGKIAALLDGGETEPSTETEETDAATVAA